MEGGNGTVPRTTPGGIAAVAGAAVGTAGAGAAGSSIWSSPRLRLLGALGAGTCEQEQ